MRKIATCALVAISVILAPVPASAGIISEILKMIGIGAAKKAAPAVGVVAGESALRGTGSASKSTAHSLGEDLLSAKPKGSSDDVLGLTKTPRTTVPTDDPLSATKGSKNVIPNEESQAGIKQREIVSPGDDLNKNPQIAPEMIGTIPKEEKSTVDQVLKEIVGESTCEAFTATAKATIRKSISEISRKIGYEPGSPLTKEWIEKISDKITKNLVELQEAGKLSRLPVCARKYRIKEHRPVIKAIFHDGLKPAMTAGFCKEKHLDDCIERVLFTNT